MENKFYAPTRMAVELRLKSELKRSVVSFSAAEKLRIIQLAQPLYEALKELENLGLSQAEVFKITNSEEFWSAMTRIPMSSTVSSAIIIKPIRNVIADLCA